MLIYSNFEREEAAFIDRFVDCTLVYEFDVLVNDAENQLTKL